MPSKDVVNLRLLITSYSVAPGGVRAAADLGLYQNPLRRPQNKCSYCLASDIIRSKVAHSEWFWQTPEPTEANPILWGLHSMWVWPVLTEHQPVGQPHPLMRKQQIRLNYKKREQIMHTRDTPVAHGSSDQEDYATETNRTPT